MMPNSLAKFRAEHADYLKLHQAFIEQARSAPIDLLFIGDSITAGWHSKAPQVWQQYYGHLNAAAFGIGGDRAEHLLWRIENGELDFVQQKVIVLLVGTNNTASHSSDEIIAIYQQILAQISQRQPHSQVLINAIFPRGARIGADGLYDDGIARNRVIARVNTALAQMADGKLRHFLDISAQLRINGVIDPAIMPDQLHPAQAGYAIWAQALQPLLEKYLPPPLTKAV